MPNKRGNAAAQKRKRRGGNDTPLVAEKDEKK
jgi:hypothetical protein